ncbi:hypothetical protein ACFLRZ_04375 [Bacteroidota bacterium]
MKRFTINILIILLVSLISFNMGCKKTEEKEEVKPTNINISIVPLQGETVDVSTLSVELHSSAMYTNAVYATSASGSPTASVAKFSDPSPGTYYLIAWNDMDSNAEFSTGDIFGFYVHPLEVEAGVTYNVTLEMFEL